MKQYLFDILKHYIFDLNLNLEMNQEVQILFPGMTKQEIISEYKEQLKRKRQEKILGFLNFRLPENFSVYYTIGLNVYRQTLMKNSKDVYCSEFFAQKDTIVSDQYNIWVFAYIKIKQQWKFLGSKIIGNITKEQYQEYMKWKRIV